MSRTKMEPPIVPQELLTEILLKLPVKSLIRFKLVCKSWLSLISDPQFTKSHFDLAHALTQNVLLLSARFTENGIERVALSVDVDAPSLQDDSAISVKKLNCEIPLHPLNNVRIVGSCRGFIVLECSRDLYICNPCTGFLTQLPPYRINYEVPRFSLFLMGFGYDHSTDDYLVVVASHNPRLVPRYCPDNRAQFFSSRANEWKELEAEPLYRIPGCLSIDCGFREGLNFSGAIHWLARCFGSRRSADFVVAFDLIERVFFEIELPNDFGHNRDDCRLVVLGGFLCVCEERNVGSEIWVMREYKVPSSWTKSLVVVPPHDISYLNFSAMCFTKSGDIVGIDSDAKLIKFNDKGDVLDHCHCYGDSPMESGYSGRLHEKCHSILHTESLLSLPCDRMTAGG